MKDVAQRRERLGPRGVLEYAVYRGTGEFAKDEHGADLEILYLIGFQEEPDSETYVHFTDDGFEYFREPGDNVVQLTMSMAKQSWLH